MQRLVQISVLIVPGLGRNLFSVKQASRNGVVSIFDKYNPRLEANNFTLPLQELENDLYFFSLDLVSGSSAPELAMQAAATATLWHRRMGHLNRKRLDLLKKANNNGVSFDGTVPDCDVCAIWKSRQRAHPKTADQHDQHPFQLVFTYIMGQFTPETLGGYKYVSKISDERTRWTEIYFLKGKDGALHAFQSFVHSMVIPSRVRVERLRADKGKGPQLLVRELPPEDDPDRDNKGHNYITDDDDFLRDLRSYTSFLLSCPLPPNLVSGYECGRVFPAGEGLGSPSRDAASWLPSRFSLSVETRRRYGWLRMVFPGARLFRVPNWSPSGGWRHARGREHCRGELGSALSGGYAPDTAKAEGSAIVDEPGEG